MYLLSNHNRSEWTQRPTQQRRANSIRSCIAGHADAAYDGSNDSNGAQAGSHLLPRLFLRYLKFSWSAVVHSLNGNIFEHCAAMLPLLLVTSIYRY
jgi:hypothetical protein